MVLVEWSRCRSDGKPVVVENQPMGVYLRQYWISKSQQFLRCAVGPKKRNLDYFLQVDVRHFALVNMISNHVCMYVYCMHIIFILIFNFSFYLHKWKGKRSTLIVILICVSADFKETPERLVVLHACFVFSQLERLYGWIANHNL